MLLSLLPAWRSLIPIHLTSRAKVFIFFAEDHYGDQTFTNIWKERGLGDVKILRNTENNKCTVCLNQEKTFKNVLNFMVDPRVELVWLLPASLLSPRSPTRPTRSPGSLPPPISPMRLLRSLLLPLSSRISLSPRTSSCTTTLPVRSTLRMFVLCCWRWT